MINCTLNTSSECQFSDADILAFNSNHDYALHGWNYKISLPSTSIEDPRKSTAAIIIIAFKQLNKCYNDACIAIIVKTARLSPTLREVS